MVVVMSSFGAKTFIWPHQDLHCMVVIEEMKGEDKIKFVDTIFTYVSDIDVKNIHGETRQSL